MFDGLQHLLFGHDDPVPLDSTTLIVISAMAGSIIFPTLVGMMMVGYDLIGDVEDVAEELTVTKTLKTDNCYHSNYYRSGRNQDIVCYGKKWDKFLSGTWQNIVTIPFSAKGGIVSEYERALSHSATAVIQTAGEYEISYSDLSKEEQELVAEKLRHYGYCESPDRDEVICKGKNYIDSKDGTGKTRLMLAVSHGDADATQRFIDAGSNVNVSDYNGNTALIIAIAMPYDGMMQEIVSILLRAGADAHKSNNRGETALSLAEERKDQFGQIAYHRYNRVAAVLREAMAKKSAVLPEKRETVTPTFAVVGNACEMGNGWVTYEGKTAKELSMISLPKGCSLEKVMKPGF